MNFPAFFFSITFLTVTIFPSLFCEFASRRFSLFGDDRADIRFLDGQKKSGDLTALSASELELMVEGSAIRVPLQDVMSIEFPERTVVSLPESQLLTLVDGSQLTGLAAARTAQQFTLETAGLGMLNLESRAVRSVRLQPENPAWRSQWATFQERESDRDLLVVVRRNGAGLDFLSGVVVSISAEKTEFLLEGDTVPVPAARVYGVVFGQPPAPPGSRPAGGRDPAASTVITTVSGDQVTARSLIRDDDRLVITTGWGQSLELLWPSVRSIDLSRGRLRFLSDLPPLEERFDGVDPQGSLLAGLIDAEQQKLLFGPRRDTSLERPLKLRLRGREFTKGMCIHSRTEISWALDRQFSRLDCVVGIDDEVAYNGRHQTLLRISGDGNVLFEKLISTTDDPVTLQLPVESISTLTVLVDFGDGESVCDWLNLADARLIIAAQP